MTQEKLSLRLPVVFNCGPMTTEESLKKYCILLSGDDKEDSDRVRKVVTAVVEGAIR